MPAVRRRLFTLAAGVSAVLCVAVCALWVRSYRVDEWWLRNRADGNGRYAGTQTLHVGGGKLRADHWWLDQSEPPRDRVDTSPRHITTPRVPVGWRWSISLAGRTASPTGRFLGWEWGKSRDTEWVSPAGWHDFTYDDLLRADGVSPSNLIVNRPASGTAYVVVVPLGWLVAFAALPPAVWASARLRRRVAPRPGLCPACGYDLRATPEKGGTLLGRCPECGTLPARASRRSS